MVAMSGGTGSALLAYIVASVFDENTVACIGRSGSLPAQKLERARYTADLIGGHRPHIEILEDLPSCSLFPSSFCRKRSLDLHGWSFPTQPTSSSCKLLFRQVSTCSLCSRD